MIVITIRKNTILKTATMVSLVIDILLAANTIWLWWEPKNWFYIFWAMAQLWMLLYSIANFPRRPRRKRKAKRK